MTVPPTLHRFILLVSYSPGEVGRLCLRDDEGVVVGVGPEEEGAAVVVERVGQEPHRARDRRHNQLKHQTIFLPSKNRTRLHNIYSQ